MGQQCSFPVVLYCCDVDLSRVEKLPPPRPTPQANKLKIFFVKILCNRKKGAPRLNTQRKKIHCCRSGPGIRCLFDPWIRDPGWVKSRMRIRDQGWKNSDPGWKKVGSGINIPDPQRSLEAFGFSPRVSPRFFFPES
jgi:hypothetical protein